MFRLTLQNALLGAALLTASPAVAMADTTCGLDARNSHNVPLPVIGRETMPPALAAEIQRGFHLVYIEFRSAEAEQLLLATIKQAQAAHNPCAEGLATFGTAQAARNIRLPDALPRFLNAEKLLRPVATPLTMAYVKERTWLVALLTGDASVKQDYPALQREFHEYGDEATSIYQRSTAPSLAPGQTRTDYQSSLFEEISRINAPNAVMVRGFIQFMWGTALQNASQFPAAMEHLRLSVHYLKQCDCGPVTLASSYLLMSFLSSKQDSAAVALGYALQGENVYRRFHLDAPRPDALRIIGSAYVQLQEYERGIAAFKEGMALAEKQHTFFLMKNLVVLLAQAYYTTGRSEVGLALMKQYEHLFGPTDQCQYQGALAIIEMGAKLWKTSEEHARYSVDQCPDAFPLPDQANNSAVLAFDLMKQNRLDDALKYAQSAITMVEKQRRNIDATDRNHTGFDALYEYPYSTLVNILGKMHRPEEAMMVSEQFRARPFLDLVNTPRERVQPDTELAALAKASSAKSGARGARSGSDLLTETTDTRKSVTHPFTLTFEDIRKTVDLQKTTLVSYWMQADDLSIWVMAPGKPLTQTLVPFNDDKTDALVRETLPKDVAGGRGARVKTRSGKSESINGGNSKPWRELYKLLIEPIESQLPKEPGSQITFVPERGLLQLSFAALQDADGHYLVEKYAINTVPAAGVLQVTARNETAADSLPPAFLLVGSPEHFPAISGSPLPPLPGTATEIRNISRTLSGRPVTTLTGRHAGIDTVAASLPQATSLHFATHAIVSDTTPMSSFLALDSRQQGGRLTAASVYDLQLHANLVVLSACSTGRGRISGDGVAGLSRAFFYAGAASLVTTLWDVVDEPTAQLMPKFYSGLAKGETRSAALRSAQLSLINDLRHHRVRVETLSGKSTALPENPAYWAAFSLSGQP